MPQPFTFGSFSPGSSPLHEADARTKLISGIAFIAAALNAATAPTLTLLFALVAAAYCCAHVPFGRVVKSALPLFAIVALASVLNLFNVKGGAVLVFVGPLSISEQGAVSFAIIACRLAAMMLAMSLITLTTSPTALADGFEKLLMPLERLNVPVRELAMIMGLALRFMPQFGLEMNALKQAQESRGSKLPKSPDKGLKTISSLLTPLMASAQRHSVTLSEAMESRCYSASGKRTRLKESSFGAADALVAAWTCIAVAGIIVLKLFGL